MSGTIPLERSLRSVFVGNIPYDATEEQLKERFSEVGPVVSFRLVYDRDSGKPKGYGFCEYKDPETAQSAMRNLGNIELNGRMLRVDSAANEKTREEMNRNFGGPGGGFIGGPGPGGPPGMGPSMGGPAMIGQGMGPSGPGGPPMPGAGPPPSGFVESSPFGPEIDPEKAPEAISSVVASLPPEQMFELAKQMKLAIQNNPHEAREMLLQNPQLAYALLQALVVMRVVDPQVAMNILHRETPVAPLVPPMDQGRGSSFPDFRPQPSGIPAPMPVDPRARDPRIDPRIQSRQDPRLAANTGQSGQNQDSTDELTRIQIYNQVVNLSDAEIAVLPPEQREAIIVLKAELARSRGHMP